MKDPQAEAQRWIQQASADLDVARTLFDNGHWWAACFHAQQAAEKAVKSYLYGTGERLVLGHSVAQLVQQAAERDTGFRSLAEAAARLDTYYIGPRYPNAVPGGVPAQLFSEGQAREALDLADRVLSFVNKEREDG